MPVPVNVENVVRAGSDRTFASLQADAGGVNRLQHNRAPAPIERQPVIRMNRDTLYRAAVDISQGATVTVPEGGDRYVSVMVVNQDHYINRSGRRLLADLRLQRRRVLRGERARRLQRQQHHRDRG